MKNLFNQLFLSAFLLVSILSSVCNAQNLRKNDVIKLRDNTKLEVVIKEVQENVIKYKKISDVDGPLFSVNKSEISSIEYGNGEVQNFEVAVEVPNYYSPNQKTPPAAVSRAPIPRNKFEEDIQKATPEKLRVIYNYHKVKSKNGLAIGIAGVTVGVLVAGIGTGIVVGATDPNGQFKSYQDELRARNGAWMMIGGFVGATTFGTIGFVKAGKNGSKATRVKRELTRRGESLSFNINPGFNAVSRAGYLTLNMKF
ncbi:hypothetical protein [Dyadobacter sp. CY312]|uniref:hypothetical protein n=1 Tax=Dyadobacter sp. CY312 TaxID=2907303 RepID=UPI001F1D5E31|nr:hypothetical protein [Dyadobacter sp. CY312]MCE7044289.1 hypothetical protein [Dyadobacter sp. CY312]